VEERDSDPDNWFDEPDVSDAWEARSERVARSRAAGEPETVDDDWLTPAESPPSRRRRPAGIQRRQVALAGAAVLVVALLLGILAAAGVFSSGGHPATAPPTTPTASTPSTTTQQTTTTTASQLTVPSAPLKPGDKGAAVKQLQRVLARLGYSPGKLDGSYGPGTESAVKKFQQAQGLVADGIAGSKTLAALKSALP
jgi:hypothetical protein